MSRLSFAVRVHFVLAKQQLTSIGRHLEKRPPDEAGALAVIASAMQEMCTGLAELTDLVDELR
jgi:hypothetical protein